MQGIHICVRQEMPQARRSCWRVVGEEVKGLCLPEVTEKEEEPHEAVALAVVAESLEDVLRCRRQVQGLAARCRCWLLCSGLLAEAAAEAAVEVGAMAVIGTAQQFKAISLQLGMDCSAPLRIVEEEGQLRLLQQQLQAAEGPRKALATATEPYVVEIDSSKASKGAQCRRCERQRPKEGQVEIQSSLWALNFRGPQSKGCRLEKGLEVDEKSYVKELKWYEHQPKTVDFPSFLLISIE